MTIPSVTCGSNIELSYDVSSRIISLSATATNSPTSYEWTLLSVPDGSTADVGTNQDFVNGVSSVQNPDIEIDGAIDGTYVFQCTATNGDGTSKPSVDQENGQQLIVVKTQKLELFIPNDYAYNWGLVYLNKTLRELEDKGIFDNSADEINQITVKGTPVGADKILIEDSADSWNKKGVTITSLPLYSPLTTKGDLYGYNTGDARIPVGSDGQVLTADSSESLGVKWDTVSSGGSFNGYEDEFTATLSGQETFTLTTSAATNTNFPAGYTIIGVYVNGVKQKYSSNPGTREYDMGSTPAANTVRVGDLTIGDEIEIVYGA